MAIKKLKTLRVPKKRVDMLTKKLADEIRRPDSQVPPPDAPVILAEEGGYDSVHLYAVAEAFADIPQETRSRMIMDAYERVRGRAELLKVTIAMGLTPAEATEMGIDWN